ncbi:TadE/TadG family type IV pilus assembly protein [Arthrobacter sp. H5]|uniref:TadE/TadG family type IV pilus assembly protein n=1 Tax=Arthrobacter sp. H5 TaxID=1267973 RepID=UPI0004B306BE|nr:TadE/TadG family type IV pilus assembly protein [Arthrobacter sp. H5]
MKALLRRIGDARSGRRGNESGSAVVDFALVGALLTVVFIAIIQLALVLHVRNSLIDAASSGARYGTLADRTPGDAAARTSSLISGSLNSGFAQDITVGTTNVDGIELLRVTVRAPLPVIGLIGPGGAMEVSGHAVLPQ